MSTYDNNLTTYKSPRNEELILAKQHSNETSSHLRAVTVKVEQLEAVPEEHTVDPDPHETKLISQKILSAIQRE